MLESAQGFFSQISVVKDALTAYGAGGVHAMHDPTEGGILNGVHEMADAAGLGRSQFLRIKSRLSLKPRRSADSTKSTPFS